jgi:hypothetical protein
MAKSRPVTTQDARGQINSRSTQSPIHIILSGSVDVDSIAFRLNVDGPATCRRRECSNAPALPELPGSQFRISIAQDCASKGSLECDMNAEVKAQLSQALGCILNTSNIHKSLKSNNTFCALRFQVSMDVDL